LLPVIYEDHIVKFTGFHEQTNEYFWGAKLENTKAYYENNKEIYLNCVKQPLHALHQDLMPTAQFIDPDICVTPARCVSRAFNDFRYSGKIYPIKSYMHLHFCATVAREDEDTPGLFFGASYSGWDCGFFVHHATNAGMAAFREAILNDVDSFVRLVDTIHADPRIHLGGEEYKKDRFPDLPKQAKMYLNKKSFYLISEYGADDPRYYSDTLVGEIDSVWRRIAPIYHFYLSAIREKNSGCL
jgi:uncharacterized protein (DUF2461 family)